MRRDGVVDIAREVSLIRETEHVHGCTYSCVSCANVAPRTEEKPLMSTAVTAAVEAPAAGSPMIQIAIATAFASLTTVLLLVLVMGHRSGRSTVLARAANASTRWMGVEPWAALPMTVASVGLIAGGFGVFWDIALHIDVGRDEGPLANPSHYPILFALYSIFAAGVLSIALHEKAEKPAPRALNLPGGYSAPIGGALLLLCGIFALSGFPMDDMWHRMFGQDVTLWGPTHLVMINGAILTPPILAVLALESKHARGHSTLSPARSIGESITRAFIPGALLFSIAFWATEFDWGVPQYRMVWHPLLLSLGAAFALVAGRLWLGRGGALKTVAFYLVARTAMELATAGLGQTAPAMPIFLVEALLIEAVAWRMTAERSPLRFGAICGLVVGTAGFAFEYAWMAKFSPQPWSPAILAEGVPTAIAAGIAGGVLGSLLGSAMYGTLPGQVVRRRAALGSVAVLVVLGVMPCGWRTRSGSAPTSRCSPSPARRTALLMWSPRSRPPPPPRTPRGSTRWRGRPATSASSQRWSSGPTAPGVRTGRCRCTATARRCCACRRAAACSARRSTCRVSRASATPA